MFENKDRFVMVLVILGVFLLIGTPSFRSFFKKRVFPGNIVVNLSDYEESPVAVPFPKEAIKYEAFDQNFVNLKVREDVAEYLSKYIGTLVSEDHVAKIYQVTKPVKSGKFQAFTKISKVKILNDGKVFGIVGKAGKLKLLYDFNDASFFELQAIKDLAQSDSIIEKIGESLIIHFGGNDSSVGITEVNLVFYGQDKKPLSDAVSVPLIPIENHGEDASESSVQITEPTNIDDNYLGDIKEFPYATMIADFSDTEHQSTTSYQASPMTVAPDSTTLATASDETQIITGEETVAASASGEYTDLPAETTGYETDLAIDTGYETAPVTSGPEDTTSSTTPPSPSFSPSPVPSQVEKYCGKRFTTKWFKLPMIIEINGDWSTNCERAQAAAKEVNEALKYELSCDREDQDQNYIKELLADKRALDQWIYDNCKDRK